MKIYLLHLNLLHKYFSIFCNILVQYVSDLRSRGMQICDTIFFFCQVVLRKSLRNRIILFLAKLIIIYFIFKLIITKI